MYTNLAQTLWLSQTLKPAGYKLVDLPYDLFCPSVQEKLMQDGSSRYQCKLNSYKKVYTTLALAQKHFMLSGHDQLHVLQDVDVDDEDSGPDEECDEAVIIPTGQISSFMSAQFEEC